MNNNSILSFLGETTRKVIELVMLGCFSFALAIFLVLIGAAGTVRMLHNKLVGKND